MGKTINFIIGGLIGDFIQCLFAVKHLCKKHQAKANLYVTDDGRFGGDNFRFSISKVYSDLYPVIIQQDYINSFEIYQNQTQDLINLNNFRRSPYLYRGNWTELLQNTFGFTYENPYQWVTIKETNPELEGKILLHRSTRRHSQDFPFRQIIDKYREQIVFISNDPGEYESFPFKSEIQYYKTETLIDVYSAINSCKFFIGNQSSPYTLATSVDKLRVLELVPHSSDRIMSLGEDKYSSNIMDVSKIL